MRAGADFLSKNEGAAAMAAVAADKASEQAKSQIIAKSKMSKAEKCVGRIPDIAACSRADANAPNAG
jgi:hypothetical protein